MFFRLLLFGTVQFFLHTADAQRMTGAGAVGDVSNAQQFMNDANGRPILLHTEYEIEGSPFYTDTYCTARLTIRNGKTYQDVPVKINLLTKTLLYKDAKGNEMESTSPVDRVEWTACGEDQRTIVVVSGFPAVDAQDEKDFYLQLDSGKVQLLKYVEILYHDVKPYGSPNTKRVFERKERYYVYRPGSGLQRLTNSVASVLQLLHDQRAAVSKYISQNNLRCRKEQELLQVFSYYNRL
jgi:hypothetical protein